MFKINHKNTKTTSMTLSFIVNFEHIPHLFLVFLLITLNKEMLARFSTGQFMHIV